MTALNLNRPITLSLHGRRSKATEGIGAAEPRANLLPPSVLAAQRGRVAVRRVVIAVVLVAATAVAAVVLAVLNAGVAQAQLDGARAQTDDLVAQQAQFSEVGATIADIDRLTAARSAVGASDVLWADYLDKITATLPAGVTFTSIDIQATTPVNVVEQSVAPLAATRVAALTFTVSSGDLASVEAWIDALGGLPGYVDATLTSVTQSETSYQSTVALSLDETIYSGRFDEESK
jgi:Tfp pilus assembly protein PilN